MVLQPRRQHPREELVELLWPGVELDAGRNRLRQTLSTLRALLETPEAPLLQVDRQQISLLPGAPSADTVEFEAALAAGNARAAALYGGELLPGISTTGSSPSATAWLLWRMCWLRRRRR